MSSRLRLQEMTPRTIHVPFTLHEHHCDEGDDDAVEEKGGNACRPSTHDDSGGSKTRRKFGTRRLSKARSSRVLIAEQMSSAMQEALLNARFGCLPNTSSRKDRSGSSDTYPDPRDSCPAPRSNRVGSQCPCDPDVASLDASHGHDIRTTELGGVGGDNSVGSCGDCDAREAVPQSPSTAPTSLESSFPSSPLSHVAVQGGSGDPPPCFSSAIDDKRSMLRPFRSCMTVPTLEESLGRSSSNATAATATTSRCSSRSSASAKSVRFDRVEIREYPRTIGDNPAVTSGPPITLAWEDDEETRAVIDMEEYEADKPEPRRKYQIVAPRLVREQWLRDAGYTRSEIAAAVRDANHEKRNRNRTVHNLHFFWIEDAYERATWLVRRYLLREPSSKVLYKEWLERRVQEGREMDRLEREAVAELLEKSNNSSFGTTAPQAMGTGEEGLATPALQKSSEKMQGTIVAIESSGEIAEKLEAAAA